MARLQDHGFEVSPARSSGGSELGLKAKLDAAIRLGLFWHVLSADELIFEIPEPLWQQ
jgi:hypothetical protein